MFNRVSGIRQQQSLVNLTIVNYTGPTLQAGGDQESLGAPSMDIASTNGDIHGLYKYLFENDLKSAKEKTLEQLENIKDMNDENIRDSELLKV